MSEPKYARPEVSNTPEVVVALPSPNPPLKNRDPPTFKAVSKEVVAMERRLVLLSHKNCVEPAKPPFKLNCTCVFAPPGDVLRRPTSSSPQTRRPSESVSNTPLPTQSRMDANRGDVSNVARSVTANVPETVRVWEGASVPIPTLPKRSIKRSELLADPTNKRS